MPGKLKYLPILLLAAGLAGCVTDAEQNAQARQVRFDRAMQSYKSVADECNSRKVREELKSSKEWALCVNEAQRTYQGPVEPYGDLMQQEMAYRLVLAEQMDQKRITKDEANLKFAQFRSDLVAEATRRQAMQAQAAASMMTGTAAMMSAMPRFSVPQSTLGQQPLSQNPQIHCTSVGTGNTVSTNCY